MSRRRDNVVRFPGIWVRAWLICRVEGEQYRGEVYGMPVDGPSLTEQGPHDMVLSRLERPDARRGLPIVPCWTRAPKAASEKRMR